MILRGNMVMLADAMSVHVPLHVHGDVKSELLSAQKQT